MVEQQLRTPDRASFDAPKSSNIETISRWPFCDATISGVRLFSWTATKSTGAPLIKSSRTCLVSPSLQAMYNRPPCSSRSIIGRSVGAGGRDDCCRTLAPSSEPPSQPTSIHQVSKFKYEPRMIRPLRDLIGSTLQSGENRRTLSDSNRI